MWRVVKTVNNFRYWLQLKDGHWIFNGLKQNGHKFTFKEEAAREAINFHSKRADTTIEKV